MLACRCLRWREARRRDRVAGRRAQHRHGTSAARQAPHLPCVTRGWITCRSPGRRRRAAWVAAEAGEAPLPGNARALAARERKSCSRTPTSTPARAVYRQCDCPETAGQTCSAGSRLVVERSRYEQVLAMLAARFAGTEGRPGASPISIAARLIRSSQKDAVPGSLPKPSATVIPTVAHRTIVAPTAPCRRLVTGRAAPCSRRAAGQPSSRANEVFGPVLAAMAVRGPKPTAVRTAKRDAVRACLRRSGRAKRGPRQLRMGACDSQRTGFS
jgi:hypothetical protein